jgi:hypothetical protein
MVSRGKPIPTHVGQYHTEKFSDGDEVDMILDKKKRQIYFGINGL